MEQAIDDVLPHIDPIRQARLDGFDVGHEKGFRRGMEQGFKLGYQQAQDELTDKQRVSGLMYNDYGHMGRRVKIIRDLRAMTEVAVEDPVN